MDKNNEIIDNQMPDGQKYDSGDKQQTKICSVISFFKETLIYSAQVMILTLIIINFIGRVSIVQGSSMQPSLSTDNRVLVNLFIYKFSQPHRGDIIVFECPIHSGRDYIKRAIGLPGETIEIKKGVVFINGKKLNEPYIEYTDNDDMLEKTIIPQGSIYVLGDNRANSEDSRYWGPVSSKLIKGKAQVIFWPPDSFKVLK